MKRLTKVLVLIVALSTALSGIGFTEELPIDVTVPLLGNGTLTVKVRSVTAADTDLGLSALNLVPTAAITLANPWIVADQYLDLVYNVTWNANWGIKIVTDNKVFFPTLNIPGYVGIVGDILKDITPANPSSGDEVLGFGGIIKTSEVTKALNQQNPRFRAMIGWQVYTDKQPAKPAAPHDSPDFDFGTSADKTDDWKSNWAWVADKSNYVEDLATGTYKKNPDNSPYTVAQIPINFDNYTLIASGFIGAGLAQHPAMADGNADGKPDTKISDGKIAAYVAAKWGSKDYLLNQEFILPAGAYKTKLYVELIHE